MPFKEFWPLYLRAHSRPMTRAMHYLASLVGLSFTIWAVAAGDGWLCAIGIGSGYAMAVLSHWVFEGNQPLILVHPVWGAVSDVRMCLLALTGRLGCELARAKDAGGAVLVTGGGRGLAANP
ncbi:MAG: Mpo1-like protein [Dongiaceae bacterium]